MYLKDLSEAAMINGLTAIKKLRRAFLQCYSLESFSGKILCSFDGRVIRAQV